MPLLLGYWMMQLQLTGRQGACSKLEPGGRFVVVMDTVVGLGRHKWFPLTQNPLTGAGFLSRASRGSVVTLAVVFRFFSKARVDISGTGIPKLELRLITISFSQHLAWCWLGLYTVFQKHHLIIF